MGRKKAKNESNDKQTQRQLHYIHYLCIQIQRCFRGFYSRKYKRDHARRKAYCRMIEEKGKEILNNMQQYVFEQTEVMHSPYHSDISFDLLLLFYLERGRGS